MHAIKTDNLTRKFKNITAVDGLSFIVENGDLFGLLGPNGAGKTTIINMLSTLIRPTSGSAEVCGFDVCKDKSSVRKSIGIVFQEPTLDNKLTGMENLEFHAMMYGMNKTNRRKRIDEVLGLVDLKDKAGIIVENYSGGMKRRLEIARGLIHKPKVLFLDEPTLGLDTQTRRHIWDYIKKLNKESDVTIILTTHYMEEADYLCNRVAIVDYGKITAMDTPAKLKDILGGDVISFGIEKSSGARPDCFKKIEWIKTVKMYPGQINLTLQNGEKRIAELINIARDNGLHITSVYLHKPSLEDVFLHFIGKTIRENESSQGERNREQMRGWGKRSRR